MADLVQKIDGLSFETERIMDGLRASRRKAPRFSWASVFRSVAHWMSPLDMQVTSSEQFVFAKGRERIANQ